MTDYRITDNKWVHPATAACDPSRHSRPGGPPCKPVLVLDPDDAEQMQAFSSLYEAARYHHGSEAKEAAAAVRSMLEPEPEYPPEPGMDARVIAGGWQWAKTAAGHWCPFARPGVPPPGMSWPDLCRDFGPVEIITPDGDA